MCCLYNVNVVLLGWVWPHCACKAVRHGVAVMFLLRYVRVCLRGHISLASTFSLTPARVSNFSWAQVGLYSSLSLIDAFCFVVLWSGGDLQKRHARNYAKRSPRITKMRLGRSQYQFKIIQNETSGASGDLLAASCFQDHAQTIP